MSLGTGTIGTILNGANQATTVFQFRPITATLTGGNLLVRIPNGSSASIFINFQDVSGNSGKIRFAARSVESDTWQALLSGFIELDRWHTVVAHADFAAGQISIWIDGVSHGSLAVTFGQLTYSHAAPTGDDSVGGPATPPSDTNAQLDGRMSFLAFYVNNNSPGTIASDIESGIHPFDVTPGPAFFMNFGAETPDLEKVNEVITSSIAGSLPAATGPTPVVIPEPSPPIITSPLTADATVGQPFSYNIIAENSEGASYDASPLPASLVLDIDTGEITGTVDVANEYSITLTVTNQDGQDIETLVLTAVNAAPASGDYLPVPSRARGRSHPRGMGSGKRRR